MMLGDGEELISVKVIGELSKDGDVELCRLIHKAGAWNGVLKYSRDSTLYVAYQIVSGETRKQVLKNLKPDLLYRDKVKRYNEGNGEL